MMIDPYASTPVDVVKEEPPTGESDDEFEEITMVLRLDGVLDTATVRENVRTGQCTVRRVASGQPLVQMGKSLYSAEWAQTMGTDLLLKSNEQQQLELVSVSSVRMNAEKALASAPSKEATSTTQAADTSANRNCTNNISGDDSNGADS